MLRVQISMETQPWNTECKWAKNVGNIQLGPRQLCLITDYFTKHAQSQLSPPKIEALTPARSGAGKQN